MTTAPSTIMPKSIAPRLIRFALNPKKKPHIDETDKHCQGNDGGGDQRRTNVAKKEEEDDSHKDEALEQVLFDRAYRSVDDGRLIVEGNDFDAGRKVHVLDLLLDGFDDAFSVLSFEHDYHAGNGLSVAEDCPHAGRRTDADLSNIAQKHRDATT